MRPLFDGLCQRREAGHDAHLSGRFIAWGLRPEVMGCKTFRAQGLTPDFCGVQAQAVRDGAVILSSTDPFLRSPPLVRVGGCTRLAEIEVFLG